MKNTRAFSFNFPFSDNWGSVILNYFSKVINLGTIKPKLVNILQHVLILELLFQQPSVRGLLLYSSAIIWKIMSLWEANSPADCIEMSIGHLR